MSKGESLTTPVSTSSQERSCSAWTATCCTVQRLRSASHQEQGQMNGYSLSSMMGSIPKKSFNTDSAVQKAPSTQA